MERPSAGASTVTLPPFHRVLMIWLLLWVCLPGFSEEPAHGSAPPSGQAPSSAPGFFFYAGPQTELAFGSQVDFTSLTAGLSGAIGYRFARWPHLQTAAIGSFSYLPLASGLTALVYAFGGNAGGALPLGQRLLFEASAGIGLFIGDFIQRTDLEGKFSGYIRGDLHLSCILSPHLGIGLGLSYTECFSFYRGIGLRADLRYSPDRGIFRAPKRSAEGSSEGRRPSPMAVDADLGALCPMLIQSYGKNPIGSVSVMNRSRTTASDVTVRVFLDGIANGPVLVISAESLQPGDKIAAPVLADLNDDLLENLQDTETAVRIETAYRIRSEKVLQTDAAYLRVYARGTFLWDDIRTAAAFIAPADPLIQRYARTALSAAPDASPNGIDENLLKAITLHEALSLSGITYAHEDGAQPGSIPWRSRPIGRLRVPGETLVAGRGDLRELAVLYCSLFEAAGVETSLVSASGGFFPVFAVQESAGKVITTSRNPDMFVYREGKAWIPLDPALIESGFTAAWLGGLELWREYRRTDDYAFTPTHDAWLEYEPPETLRSSGNAVAPSRSELRDAVREQIRQVLDRGS